MRISHVLVCLTTLSASLPGVAVVNCRQADAAADLSGVRIPGHASGRQAIGSGRLQFYSAPAAACKMPGIFILPGETVQAYIEYAGYTSVMYLNAKTGSEAIGWVESLRLRANGQGIAPRQ